MNVAVTILDVAINRLWDGADEAFYYRNFFGKERFACIAVTKACASVMGITYEAACEEVIVVDIHERIQKRIKHRYTATRYLRDFDENFNGSDEYAQAFRKQLLEEIRKELA